MSNARQGARGQTLVNAKMFCIDRFGDDGWQRVRDALSPTTFAIVENADRGTWYEIEVYTELHDTIARVLGGGDLKTMVDLGYYAADYDLTQTMRLFLRVATPAFLMWGYAKLWGSYHGTGSWKVVKEGPSRLRASLTGWETPSEAACVSVAAFVERFLQLVGGGKDARVTRTQCASRGDPVCEYVLEWSAKATRDA